MARDAAHRPPGGLARPLLVALLLLALVCAAFAGVRHNGFVALDDAAYLTRNPALRGGLTWDAARWAFTATVASNWHPVTWLSHLLDVRLFGLDPAGHHLVSLVLHAANALLLFAALRGMTGAPWRSAAVAALFAVHPLRVESVAWAAERKDVLSTLFALLALLAHVASVRRPGPARRWAAAGWLALALLSKPMPVSLPFLLLLLDWWPLGRWSPGAGPPGARRAVAGVLPPGPLWVEKLPLFALAAASSAVTWAVQARTGATDWGAPIPVATRLANAAASCLHYLGAALWPQGLAPIYPYPATPPPWWLWAASLAVLVAVTVATFRFRAGRPWLAVGWLWYLGTLAPVLGLVQVGGQARADRYTYLPLTGVLLLVAWEAQRLGAGRRVLRRALAAGAAAALVALAALTHAQVARWESSERLFTHTIAVTERNEMAHAALGAALGEEGRLAEAAREFATALEIQPDAPETLFNLGLALALQGRREEAARHLERALALDPSLERARRELARLRRAAAPRGSLTSGAQTAQ